MNDGIGPEFGEEREDTTAVADIEFVMVKGSTESCGKSSLIPSRISLWSEKDGPLIVVDTMDLPSESAEMDADFGADEAGGARDEEFHLELFSCLAV